MMAKNVVIFKKQCLQILPEFCFFNTIASFLITFPRINKIVFLIYVCAFSFFVGFPQPAPKSLIRPSLFTSHNKTHSCLWFFDYSRNLEPIFQFVPSVRDKPVFINICKTDLHQMPLMLPPEDCCGRKAEECNGKVDLSDMLLVSWRL